MTANTTPTSAPCRRFVRFSREGQAQIPPKHRAPSLERFGTRIGPGFRAPFPEAGRGSIPKQEKSQGLLQHPWLSHSRRQRRRHKAFQALPALRDFGVVNLDFFSIRGCNSQNRRVCRRSIGVVDTFTRRLSHV